MYVEYNHINSVETSNKLEKWEGFLSSRIAFDMQAVIVSAFREEAPHYSAETTDSQGVRLIDKTCRPSFYRKSMFIREQALSGVSYHFNHISGECYSKQCYARFMATPFFQAQHRR